MPQISVDINTTELHDVVGRITSDEVHKAIVADDFLINHLTDEQINKLRNTIAAGVRSRVSLTLTLTTEDSD